MYIQSGDMKNHLLLKSNISEEGNCRKQKSTLIAHVYNQVAWVKSLSCGNCLLGRNPQKNLKNDDFSIFSDDLFLIFFVIWAIAYRF